MSFISSVASEVAKKFGYTKSPGVVSSPSWPNILSPTLSAESLTAYKGWVYANVKRRAEQMSNVELKLVRYQGDDVVPVENHPAEMLLLKPNLDMTQRELMEFWFMHLDLSGESFTFVERSGLKQTPTALIPMFPHRMTVKPGTGNAIIGSYTYKVQQNGEVKELPLTKEEVLFQKETDPNVLHRGMGIVRAAYQTIDTDEAQEKWNWKWFENGASMKPMFETDQFINEDALKVLYGQLHTNWSGLDNAHKAMILHSGLKLSPQGFTHKEMEYLEGQRWTRDKLMALFGMTKTLLGVTEDVNFSNAAVAEMVFAKYTLKPRIQKVVDYLNEFYLPMFPGTEELYFIFEDPTPVNASEQADIYTKALAGGGWKTPNEVRAEQGLPPVPKGDEIYAPMNMQPLGTEPPTPQPFGGNDKPKYVSNSRQKLVRYRQKKLQEQAEKITEVAYKAAEGIVKRYVTQKKTFREQALSKGGFHELMVKDALSFEQRMKKSMQTYFNTQEQFVLNTMGRNFYKSTTWQTKSPADNFLFDDQFEEQGVRLVLPILSDVLDKRGNEALFFIGSRIGFKLDNPRAQKYIKRQAGNLIKDIDATTKERLRIALDEGLNQGEGIPDLSERVRKVFDQADDSRSETIARTEVIKASNFASEEAWRQSGVVEGKEWLTAEDERVEEMCAAMDGKIVSLQGSYFEEGDTLSVGDQSLTFDATNDFPPLHPNCRCTIIPVLVGQKSVIVNRAPTVSPKKIEQLNKRFEELSKKI